jgi:hypothetical protein
VVVAVPGGAVAEALNNVQQGVEGKTVIDATNLIGVDPPPGFSSNAEFVKSRTNGPTAKWFNTNFASLYDRIRKAGSTPSNLWSGDEEARQVVEQLNRDAGYEPAYAGTLENAAAQENFLKLTFGISQGGWAHSCIGLRFLINSESTIEEDRRTSDEHDGCGRYGDGGWEPCRAARRPANIPTHMRWSSRKPVTWVRAKTGSKNSSRGATRCSLRYGRRGRCTRGRQTPCSPSDKG